MSDGTSVFVVIIPDPWGTDRVYGVCSQRGIAERMVEHAKTFDFLNDARIDEHLMDYTRGFSLIPDPNTPRST